MTDISEKLAELLRRLDRAKLYEANGEPDEICEQAASLLRSQAAINEAACSALDIADRLIERSYGTDTPAEWHDAYRAVAKARSQKP